MRVKEDGEDDRTRVSQFHALHSFMGGQWTTAVMFTVVYAFAKGTWGAFEPGDGGIG